MLRISACLAVACDAMFYVVLGNFVFKVSAWDMRRDAEPFGVWEKRCCRRLYPTAAGKSLFFLHSGEGFLGGCDSECSPSARLLFIFFSLAVAAPAQFAWVALGPVWRAITLRFLIFCCSCW